MRRMLLLPLAGLVLSNVIGCSCIMGHCDCDQTPTMGCHVYPVGPTQAPPVAAPLPVESIKELPRALPDK